MSELGKRWGVAGVGIPAVLGLGYLGGWFLAVPLAGFAAWATHESYRLARRKNIAPLGALGSTVAAAFVLLAAWRPSFTAFAPFALGLILVATSGALVAAIFSRGPARNPLAAVAITIFGAVYVGLSLAFMLLLHGLPAAHGWAGNPPASGSGLLVLALPLAATWVGDAAAFFAGTAWGRKKLAPTISPNKSWVGFWAELGGGAIASILWLVVAQPRLPGLQVGGFIGVAVIGAVLGLAAVAGDLAESLLKREAGVKDSGTFFPGHGGVLDRIDSLVFTVPTAYCFLVLLAWLS